MSSANHVRDTICRIRQVLIYMAVWTILMVPAAMAQQLDTAFLISGDDESGVSDLAVDAHGNAYVTGTFKGTMDVDPGPGTYFLTSNGEFDIFLAKYDAESSLVWAFSFGSTQWDHVDKLVIDNNQQVIIAGYFYDTVDFDPGPGVHNLTSAGVIDPFIASYNMANGAFRWANGVEGYNVDFVDDIGVDKRGGVYLLIHMLADVLDFDGDAITGRGGEITKKGNCNNLVVARYTPRGRLQRLRSIGSLEGPDSCVWVGGKITFDDTNHFYLAGNTQGVVDIDMGPGERAMSCKDEVSTCSYVAKYDQTMKLKWVFNVDASSFYDVDFDDKDGIVLTGWLHGAADFDPSSREFWLSANNHGDALLARYRTNGTFDWAFNIGGDEQDLGFGVVTLPSGVIYTTGSFRGTVDFDPGPGVYNLTSDGIRQWYVARYNAPGKLAWAFKGGEYRAVAAAGKGYVQVGGTFVDPLDVDPGPGSVILTGNGVQSGYMARYIDYKYGKPGEALVDVAGEPLVVGHTASPESWVLDGAYPNPFNPTTKIRFGVPESGNVQLIVYDMLGREVEQLVNRVVDAGWHEVSFEAAGYPSGVYLYKLETPEGIFTRSMLLLK